MIELRWVLKEFPLGEELRTLQYRVFGYSPVSGINQWLEWKVVPTVNVTTAAEIQANDDLDRDLTGILNPNT